MFGINSAVGRFDGRDSRKSDVYATSVRLLTVPYVIFIRRRLHRALI